MPKKIVPYIESAITGVKLGGCGIYLNIVIIIKNEIKRRKFSFNVFFIIMP